MPINPMIPLAGQNPNWGGAVLAIQENKRENKRQNELLGLAKERSGREAAQESRAATQNANARFDDRSARRFDSIVQGAAELAPILSRGDAVAAESYLTNRKATLEAAKAQGVDVDTVETDEALNALHSGGIQALGAVVNDTIGAALRMKALRSNQQQAQPSAILQAYETHVGQAQAAGQQPLPFLDPSAKNDFTRQFAQSNLGAQYGAPSNVPGVGVVQPNRNDPASNRVLSPEANVSAAEAQRAGAEATATAKAAQGAEQQKELTANQRTLQVWGVAKQGLMKALAGTETGPVVGRLPAITSGQQIAEGAIASVAPVLKQLFRSAGEGVFTDRDQALLLDMVPKRTDHPETASSKIDMIDAIIQAKLAASIPGQNVPPQGAAPAGGAPAAGPTRIQDEAGYNALPSGAQYIAPDGTTRTKR